MRYRINRQQQEDNAVDIINALARHSASLNHELRLLWQLEAPLASREKALAAIASLENALQQAKELLSHDAEPEIECKE